MDIQRLSSSLVEISSQFSQHAQEVVSAFEPTVQLDSSTPYIASTNVSNSFIAQDKTQQTIMAARSVNRAESLYQQIQAAKHHYDSSINYLPGELTQIIQNLEQQVNNSVGTTQPVMSDIHVIVQEFKQKLQYTSGVKTTSINNLTVLMNKANGIATEYSKVAGGYPPDEAIELESQYSRIAGLPVKQLSMPSEATGGEMRGVVVGAAMIDATIGLLESEFISFKDFVNQSYGSEVVSGNDIKSSKVNDVPPAAINRANPMGSTLIQDVETAKKELSEAHEASKNAFLKQQNAFDRQVSGLEPEKSIAAMVVLQTHYAAIVKTIVAQDKMEKHLVNSIG